MIDVFLDRDGVIIRNRLDYVKSWSEVEILPGALEAIALLCSHGCRLTVVTNQSAIGRGIVARSDVDEIHRRLDALIVEAGGTITGYFVCPHTPDERCKCRKPRPGLLLQAADALGIPVERATVVGDQVADLDAATAVGCNAILVESGVWRDDGPNFAAHHHRVSDLMAAATLILANR